MFLAVFRALLVTGTSENPRDRAERTESQVININTLRKRYVVVSIVAIVNSRHFISYVKTARPVFCRFIFSFIYVLLYYVDASVQITTSFFVFVLTTVQIYIYIRVVSF